MHRVCVCVCVFTCSLRTTLCVRFQSQVIASGIIFYAARRLKVGTRRRDWKHRVGLCVQGMAFGQGLVLWVLSSSKVRHRCRKGVFDVSLNCAWGRARWDGAWAARNKSTALSPARAWLVPPRCMCLPHVQATHHAGSFRLLSVRICVCVCVCRFPCLRSCPGGSASDARQSRSVCFCLAPAM